MNLPERWHAVSCPLITVVSSLVKFAWEGILSSRRVAFVDTEKEDFTES
jgi:hypothetical protein